VVADDLSGATDTGVHFAQRGLATRVMMDQSGPLGSVARGIAVLVVATQSRHVAPQEAARRVAEVVRRGRQSGIRRFFKKTDSTLRGNVGSELEALLTASGASHLAFLPALPALGRTTRNGVQYVDGRPLQETESAADPLEPVRSSSVTELLREQTDLPIVSLGPSAFEGDVDPPLPSPSILVFDAETLSELRLAVGHLHHRGMLAAVAGTSALAQVLAERDGPRPAEHDPRFRLPGFSGPLLVIGGSLNPISLAQLDHAAGHGYATVHLPPGVLLAAAGEATPQTEATVARATRLLSRGQNVILRSTRHPEDAAACGALGSALGLAADSLRLRIAANLGLVARRILTQQRVEAVVVFGGDTLAGFIEALGQPALFPRRELLPGIPISELENCDGLFVVSKAGGFGATAEITRIAGLLREEAAQ
jgi:D-threonate/D-erythronate kinase